MKMAVFIHIPKTGGSSLMATLRREYGSSLYQIVPNRADPKGMADFVAFPKNGLRAIAGHVAYGIHDLIPTQVEYATMLRGPVARATSDYNYIRRRTDHPLHEHAMKLGVNDFFASKCAASTDNLQTRMLSGGLNIGTQAFDRPVNEDDLSRALDNLDSFSVIGLTERFDESLLIMAKELSWTRAPISFSQNRAPRTAAATVDAGLVAFDQHLYAVATKSPFLRVPADQLAALRRRSLGPRMVMSLAGRL